MRWSIISASEKQLLKKLELNNDPDLSVWRISNVWIPVISIVIALLAYGLFKDNKSNEVIAYINLILNGSVPMIALTRIGTNGIYLLKYNSSKEKQYGIGDTFWLRAKLMLFFILIFIGTIFLYVYQVLNNPFDYSWQLLFTFSFSLLAVYFAISVTKSIFLLQEKMIDVTFEKEVLDDMEKKGHGKNW